MAVRAGTFPVLFLLVVSGLAAVWATPHSPAGTPRQLSDPAASSVGPRVPVRAPPESLHPDLAPRVIVNRTLVEWNDSLATGNYLSPGCLDPVASVYDSHTTELVLGGYLSDSLCFLNTSENRLVGNISLSAPPRSLTYDPSNQGIYVATDRAVIAVNGTTGIVEGKVVSGSFSSVTYNSVNGYLYAADPVYSNLSVIAPGTGRVVANPPVGYGPDSLGYDGRSGNVYVANEDSNNLTVISGSTNKVIANVPVGSLPYAITYDSKGGEIFVSNVGSDNVSEVNTTTSRVVSTLSLDSVGGVAYSDAMNELAVGGLFTGVSGYCCFDTALINATTTATVAEIPTGISPALYPASQSTLSPDGTAITSASDNGDLYIANAWNDNVSVLDPESQRLTATVSLGSETQGLAYDAAVGGVLLANEGTNNVSLLNSSTDKIVATSFVGLAPVQVAADPTSGNLAVTNFGSGLLSGSGTVSILSGSALQVLGTVTVATAGPSGVAFVPPAGGFYVLSQYRPGTFIVRETPPGLTSTLALGTGSGIAYIAQKNIVCLDNASNVMILNATNDRPLATVANGTDPWGLAYDAENDDLYVVNLTGDDVVVVNLTSLKTVATVPVGVFPCAVAYDEATREVFVSDWQSNNVTIINASASKAVANVSVGFNPTGIVYDPSNQEVYVANQGSGTVSILSASSVAAPSIRSFRADPDPVVLGNATYLNVSLAGGSVGLSYAYTGLPGGCDSGNLTSVRCVPTTAGNYTVRVYVNDSEGRSANTTLTLEVMSSTPGPLALRDFMANPNPVEMGNETTFTSLVSGGLAPYTYLYVGLPPSCGPQNLSALSCTPGLAGNYSVNLTVRDVQGESVHASLNLTVLVNRSPAGPPGGGTSPSLESWVLWIGLAAVVGATVVAIILQARRRPPPGAADVPRTVDSPRSVGAVGSTGKVVSVFCGECGAAAGPGQTYCRKCGNPLVFDSS